MPVLKGIFGGSLKIALQNKNNLKRFSGYGFGDHGLRPWSWKGPDHGVGVDPSLLNLLTPKKSFSQFFSSDLCRGLLQGQISAQVTLHLGNPSLGPNAGKRVLDARILGRID